MQRSASDMRVAIIGVGLIGGSLAMAWKARRCVGEIVGIARREETIAEAVAVGAIDRGTLSLEEGVREADVVIIATPVRTIAPTAIAIKGHLKAGAVVTDVGSTKSDLCAEIWSHYRGADARFVGGHPMAGSERAGVAAADPYLFQNAPFIIVPPDPMGTGYASAVERLTELARAAGAIPLVMSAAAHDAIVASVSHLPHLVATSLVNAASERAKELPNMLELAAGGFRDTTRVASGPEDVWTDICMTNRAPIAAAIDGFIESLVHVRDALGAADEDALRVLLREARTTRLKLPAKSKGILGTVFDAVVTVVDRPGVIHDVTGVIGDARINIIDIEILRVREGEGGTLRLGFEREEDLQEATRLLEAKGYKVRRR